MLLLVASLLAAALPAETPREFPRALETRALALDTSAWLARADLPAPRALQCAVTAGPDRLLIIGGRTGSTGPMTADCLGYSANEDRWTGLSPMERARGLAAAAFAGGRVWVTGGCRRFGTGLAEVEVFDPVANSWSSGPALPESLHDHAAVAWRDSLVCVIGGGNWAPGSPPVDRVRWLDPAASYWFSATPLPVALGAAAAAVLGDTIIVAAGWTDSGPTNRAWRGVIDPVAPEQIAWSEIDTIPSAGRCRASATALNGRFHLAGGLLGDGRCVAETYSWDPALETWLREADLSAPRADAGPLVALGDWLHLCGGYTGTQPYTDTHRRRYAGRYVNDCGAEVVTTPRGRLFPGVPVSVRARVRNHGDLPATLVVTALVADTLTGNRLLARDTSLALEPGERVLIDFGQLEPPAGAVIATRVGTWTPGDENRANDTASALCRTTRFSDPDGYGCRWESTLEPDTVGFAWFDPGGGETLGPWLPDPDNGVVQRRLPFLFPWYDNLLNRVWVGTNGYITTSEVAVGGNLGLPWPDIEHLIAPFWDDLNLRTSGAVLETVRADTIAWTWLGVPRHGEPDRALTFQVLLIADGRVRFNYLDLDADRASSTVGIQGGDGSWYRYLEFALDGLPPERVPRDSVSVLFHRPVTGVAEQHQPAPVQPDPLACPTVWRAGPLPLALAAPARVEVWSATGRRVRVLDLEPGRATWDLRDETGRPVPAGTYFLRPADRAARGARRVSITR